MQSTWGTGGGAGFLPFVFKVCRVPFLTHGCDWHESKEFFKKKSQALIHGFGPYVLSPASVHGAELWGPRRTNTSPNSIASLLSTLRVPLLGLHWSPHQHSSAGSRHIGCFHLPLQTLTQGRADCVAAFPVPLLCIPAIMSLLVSSWQLIEPCGRGK